ncbi:ABC transporter substrate-binding protein [Thalassotalea euphylliae]|uniref:ABC transporter substrate-binding protein n=1 Tax=Thalassotalea euphylliae TaxID=1655234 RepID=UPI0036367B3D
MRLLLGIVFFIVTTPLMAKEVIRFGSLIIHERHEQAFQQLIQSFEKEHPNYQVQMRRLSGSSFDELSSKLDNYGAELDVISWHAGDRLSVLAKSGFIKPIDGLWHDLGFNQSYPSSIRRSVTVDGKVFGVPYLYYPLGFYYNKATFARLGLSAPVDWTSFIDVLKIIQADGVYPIAFGGKESWPAAAWFDYLTLRLFGEDFYKQVVNGEVNFESSTEIQQVFTLWQALVESKFFLPTHEEISSSRSLHLVAREHAAMTLIGSFSLSHIPEKVQGKLGYFPFPQIIEDVPTVEIAPTTVMSLTTSAGDNEAAELFLRYMTKPEHQKLLANSMASCSPNIKAMQKDPALVIKGAEQLNNASSTTQFFDREAPKGFAQSAQQVFIDFIDHGDVKAALHQLEVHRQQQFIHLAP